MASSQITLQAVSRIYHVGEQDVYALNNVNLDILSGDYVSIMGPSGSGKSTLLNVIGLLDTPNQGRYLLDGSDITSFSETQQAHTRQNTIGFVFQAFHLVPRLNAKENIELPMVLAGLEKQERTKRVNQALLDTGLMDRANHKPEELSGGQRQRVAIARATIMQPKIILADEPTGNLDQHSGHEVIQVLETLNKNGITLIIVTHDTNLGDRAKRQIKMLDGKISHELNR
jgi:putative ABC transport system ATP-binding protein